MLHRRRQRPVSPASRIVRHGRAGDFDDPGHAPPIAARPRAADPVGRDRRCAGRLDGVPRLDVGPRRGHGPARTRCRGRQRAGLPRLAVVGSCGRLLTMDATGGSVTPIGQPEITFSFPAWSPDGRGSRPSAAAPDDGSRRRLRGRGRRWPLRATPASSTPSADEPPFYLYWAPDGRRLTFLTTEPDGLALRIAPADGAPPSTVARKRRRSTGRGRILHICSLTAASAAWTGSSARSVPTVRLWNRRSSAPARSGRPG